MILQREARRTLLSGQKSKGGHATYYLLPEELVPQDVKDDVLLILEIARKKLRLPPISVYWFVDAEAAEKRYAIDKQFSFTHEQGLDETIDYETYRSIFLYFAPGYYPPVLEALCAAYRCGCGLRANEENPQVFRRIREDVFEVFRSLKKPYKWRDRQIMISAEHRNRDYSAV